MLGGLEQDLQDLGIATVPKGHCASCQKPIAGKVGWAKRLVLQPSVCVYVCVCLTEDCSMAFYSKTF